MSGELAVQIEKEVYKFNKLLGLRSTTFAGGLSKYQQFRTIKGGRTPMLSKITWMGRKYLGSSTIFYQACTCLCLPFVGEGWEKKYSKLEALSSVFAIPVIQQAFNAAN